jgi:hypothetical protein
VRAGLGLSRSPQKPFALRARGHFLGLLAQSDGFFGETIFECSYLLEAAATLHALTPPLNRRKTSAGRLKFHIGNSPFG